MNEYKFREKFDSAIKNVFGLDLTDEVLTEMICEDLPYIFQFYKDTEKVNHHLHYIPDYETLRAEVDFFKDELGDLKAACKVFSKNRLKYFFTRHFKQQDIEAYYTAMLDEGDTRNYLVSEHKKRRTTV